MKDQNDFTKGSVAGNIVKLALPITVAQMVNVLYNVVDRMFIGKLSENGTVALTGIGITFPIIIFITAFTNLVGQGGAPLSSIERGKGNNEMAEKIMGNSFTLLVIVGITLMTLLYIAKRPLLILFGASEQTFKYANSYLSLYLVGTLFAMIGLGLNNYINAQGFATVGMLSVIVGAVINVILDFVFIYILKMGVTGAALATVISQLCTCIWVLHFLRGEKTILRLKKSCMKLEKDIVKKILGLGTAGFVMAVTNSCVQIACNMTLSVFGGDIYIGVMTVINSIREIVMMPVHGLTSGAQPVMSYNYGAKAYKRVLSGIKFTTLSCVIYATVAWAAMHFFGQYFIRLFNDEPSLVTLAVPALTTFFFGFFMMSFQFAGQSTFVALGKSKQAIFFSILRKVVIVVPLTLLLPRFGFGAMGVFLAEPISNFIGGLASYLTMLLTVGRELSQKCKEEKMN